MKRGTKIVKGKPVKRFSTSVAMDYINKGLEKRGILRFSVSVDHNTNNIYLQCWPLFLNPLRKALAGLHKLSND